MKLGKLVSLALVTIAFGALGCDVPPDGTSTGADAKGAAANEVASERRTAENSTPRAATISVQQQELRVQQPGGSRSTSGGTGSAPASGIEYKCGNFRQASVIENRVCADCADYEERCVEYRGFVSCQWVQVGETQYECFDEATQ